MISREALARRRRIGLRQLKRWQYPLESCSDKNIGKYGDTRVPCSCCLCGNPRRRYGNSKLSKTLQEMKLLPLELENSLS